MKCEVAIERLLEADLTDLRAEGDSALSDHVRTCARCRSAAERIVEVVDEMAANLEAEQSSVPVTRALAVARQRARTRRRVRALRLVVPVAAAAGIAGLVLSRGPVPVQPSEAVAPAGIVPGVTMDVGVSPDRNVAIFSTVSRPDIVVVWFF